MQLPDIEPQVERWKGRGHHPKEPKITLWDDCFPEASRSSEDTTNHTSLYGQNLICESESEPSSSTKWSTYSSAVAMAESHVSEAAYEDASKKVARFYYAFSFRAELDLEFSELARQWYKETGMLSLARQKALHPAYQKIIGMGKDALPLIFMELKQRGGDWLWALEAINRNDNPASGITKFKDAVAAWLNWGRGRGYID